MLSSDNSVAEGTTSQENTNNNTTLNEVTNDDSLKPTEESKTQESLDVTPRELNEDNTTDTDLREDVF